MADLGVDTGSLTAAAERVGMLSAQQMPLAMATLTTMGMDEAGEPTLDGWLDALRLAWLSAAERVQEDCSTIASNTLLAATVYDDADAKLAAQAARIKATVPLSGHVEYD